MISTSMLSAAHPDDAELVTASLVGDRDAFGQIVARYQALICSLAYSATGSVRQSEDVAQETFVNAWQNLGQLRETSKLRSWLCGIVRHRISRAIERNRREPSHAAESLDAAHEAAAPEPLPSDQAISREEQAILWRSLEQIPETYREPLILFYRENQSIERVALALELSEDAVKQRLSRGRKLLQDQVASFVEGALRQTTPGRVFTLSVLEVLPALALPASAATVGMAAARGVVAAKTAASVPFAGALVGPVIGILSGWLGYKVNVENAESPREREFLKRFFRLIWGLAALFCLGLSAFVYLAIARPLMHSLSLTVASIVLMAGYCVGVALLIVWVGQTQHRIRREESAKLPAGISPPGEALAHPGLRVSQPHCAAQSAAHPCLSGDCPRRKNATGGRLDRGRQHRLWGAVRLRRIRGRSGERRWRSGGVARDRRRHARGAFVRRCGAGWLGGRRCRGGLHGGGRQRAGLARRERRCRSGARFRNRGHGLC